MGIQKLLLMVCLLVAGLLAGAAYARADMAEMKKYKEAFPEAKIKCIDCHTAAIPGKDEGRHEWNDYGKAVIAEAKKVDVKDGEPTAETYKKAGKIEDFKK